MASNGERRMLFDTRGRRKHVIRVVYAVLALLMGASLFLVVGPVNIAELVGNSSSGSEASELFDEQAERIEEQLVQTPNDEQLLLQLTRARINAGNAQIEPVAETEAPTITVGAREDFAAASEAWNLYLRQAGKEVSPAGAQLVAATFIRVAEGAGTVGEAVKNVNEAVKAQRIAAEKRPNLGTLSTLSIYEYFAGNFGAGDKVARRTAALAGSKAEAKVVDEQLDEFRKRGKEFEKQRQEVGKVERELNRESPQNPFGGFGSSAPGAAPGGE
jgi:hypothetical protein